MGIVEIVSACRPPSGPSAAIGETGVHPRLPKYLPANPLGDEALAKWAQHVLHEKDKGHGIGAEIGCLLGPLGH